MPIGEPGPVIVTVVDVDRGGLSTTVAPWTVQAGLEQNIEWQLTGAEALHVTHEPHIAWPFPNHAPVGNPTNPAQSGNRKNDPLQAGTLIPYRITILKGNQKVVIDPEIIITGS